MIYHCRTPEAGTSKTLCELGIWRSKTAVIETWTDIGGKTGCLTRLTRDAYRLSRLPLAGQICTKQSFQEL